MARIVFGGAGRDSTETCKWDRPELSRRLRNRSGVRRLVSAGSNFTFFSDGSNANWSGDNSDVKSNWRIPTNACVFLSASRSRLPSRHHFYTFAHVNRRAKIPQLKLFNDEPKAYGGDLLKKRKGRRGPRPLDTKNSMHLVLRSNHARGHWSFRVGDNPRKIAKILKRFAQKYGVRILSVANAGNHLHLHIQLGHRYGYKPFIRATTAAIAMAITGMSRWKKLDLRFWDQRPYSRVVIGRHAWAHLTKYIRVNQLEGMGYPRATAKAVMSWADMATLSGLRVGNSS